MPIVFLEMHSMPINVSRMLILVNLPLFLVGPKSTIDANLLPIDHVLVAGSIEDTRDAPSPFPLSPLFRCCLKTVSRGSITFETTDDVSGCHGANLLSSPYYFAIVLVLCLRGVVCDRIFAGEDVPGDTELLFLVFIALFFLD
jgi:hypothetical protein